MNTEGALDFQIGLEERISRIYQDIAEQFSSGSDHDTEWVALWRELARDEVSYASLLSVEKTFLQSGTRVKDEVEIDPGVRKELDRLLSWCESQVRPGLTKEEAVKILGTLEGSDVNQIFFSLLKATDSKVLSRLPDFSHQHEVHERRIQKVVQRYQHQLNASDI